MNGRSIAEHFSRVAMAVEGGLPKRGFGREVGTITEINASNIVANLKDVAIGEMCEVIDRSSGKFIRSQVVSINDDSALLAPIEPIDGLKADAEVYAVAVEIANFQGGIQAHIDVGVLSGEIRQSLNQPLHGECRNAADGQQAGLLVYTHPFNGLGKPVEPL